MTTRAPREIITNTVLIAASGVAVLVAIHHHAHRIERDLAGVRRWQRAVLADVADDLAAQRARAAQN